jgi:hypothetical protein
MTDEFGGRGRGLTKTRIRRHRVLGAARLRGNQQNQAAQGSQAAGARLSHVTGNTHRGGRVVIGCGRQINHGRRSSAGAFNDRRRTPTASERPDGNGTEVRQTGTPSRAESGTVPGVESLPGRQRPGQRYTRAPPAGPGLERSRTKNQRPLLTIGPSQTGRRSSRASPCPARTRGTAGSRQRVPPIRCPRSPLPPRPTRGEVFRYCPAR